MSEQFPVLKGTLDVLVLKALSWRSMHGFELTRWLESRSGGRLELADAALYQALYRLEKRGLVSAEWGVTEEGRRARFYDITRAGSAQLKQQTKWWLEYAQTVTSILVEAPGAS
jgi:PadR family transcriptional regulator, regulatory protein PadR